jgi:hypothetical protein
MEGEKKKQARGKNKKDRHYYPYPNPKSKPNPTFRHFSGFFSRTDCLVLKHILVEHRRRQAGRNVECSVGVEVECRFRGDESIEIYRDRRSLCFCLYHSMSVLVDASP